MEKIAKKRKNEKNTIKLHQKNYKKYILNNIIQNEDFYLVIGNCISYN